MLKNGEIILGLDISLKCTGWTIVKITNAIEHKSEIVDYGTIDTSTIHDLGTSLIFIEEQMRKIMSSFRINYIAIEQMFVSKNRVTAIRLAQMHGIALLCAAKFKLPVSYYAVMTIKSKVLDGIKTKKEDGTKKSGDEMKEEVADKIFEIYGKKRFTKKFTNDVTDAISVSHTFILMDGNEIEKVKKTRKKPTK